MVSNPGYSSILSVRAQKEIAKSWKWYEEGQQGLGDHFVKEVIAAIRKIKQTPDRYPFRYRSYKETPVPIFRFLIIYSIISVFHTSLNPKKKFK